MAMNESDKPNTAIQTAKHNMSENIEGLALPREWSNGTNGIENGSIEPATEEEEDAIREEIEEFARVNRNPQCLHIQYPTSNEPDPLCREIRSELKTRPVDAYPVGYKPICLRCLRAWRRGEHYTPSGDFTDRVTVRLDAIHTEALERFVKEGRFSNRSEAIRGLLYRGIRDE